MSARTSIDTRREWVRSLITICCNSHVPCAVYLASVRAESCVVVNLYTYHMDYTGCLVKFTNI